MTDWKEQTNISQLLNEEKPLESGGLLKSEEAVEKHNMEWRFSFGKNRALDPLAHCKESDKFPNYFVISKKGKVWKTTFSTQFTCEKL